LVSNFLSKTNIFVDRNAGGGKHSGVPFSDFPIGSLETSNTGKELYFSGTTIFTLKDGKIVEEIGEEGALTALCQLGLIQPASPGAGGREAA